MGDDPAYEKLYMSICHKLHVTPTSYFLRHIDDSKINLKHHGLNDKETIAIAEALKVSLLRQ